jgi:hypothetical protein
MGYDREQREQIHKQCLEVIEREQCVTMSEVLLYIPVSKKTFYEWGFHESDELKSAIDDEKVKVKTKLRRNWRNSDNPTLQIAEFKLASTDAELERLAMSKVKQETTMTVKPSVSIAFDGTQDDSGQSDPAV